jgi:hypothetical protein
MESSVAMSSQHGSWLPENPFIGGVAILLIAGGTTIGATQSQSSDTAPILAFGAVVIAAVIASWTAVTNVRKQIDGEGVRQAASLAHDRQLADIQHLRELLDEAAAAYEEASDAALRLSGAAEEPHAGDGLEQRVKCRQDALLTRIKCLTERDRIEMRFARDHEVYAKYDATIRAVEARVKLLREVMKGGGQLTAGDKYDEDIALGVKAIVAFKEFAEAVRREIGVRETVQSTSP